METKRPENLQEARRRARQRRLRRRRIALVSGAVVLVLLIGIGVLLALMDVTAIYVEGETRYTYEQIVEKSGLQVGQNLLSVNKQTAHDRLREAFPYLATIEVGNASFSELCITVTEVEVMAAVQVEDEYIIVGENNRALERVSSKKVPKGLLKIKGATLQSEAVGSDLMDQRSLSICRSIISHAAAYGLEGITSIDITKKNEISFLLNKRLQVKLGNETNIPTQIAVLVNTLPDFYETNGKEATGLYDMSTYSDNDTGNDRGVFTSEELLEQEEDKKQQEDKKDKDKEEEKQDNDKEDKEDNDDTDPEDPETT